MAALADDPGSVPSGSRLSHGDPPVSTTPVLELRACEATPIFKKSLRNKKSGCGRDKVGGTGKKKKRERGHWIGKHGNESSGGGGAGASLQTMVREAPQCMKEVQHH